MLLSTAPYNAAGVPFTYTSARVFAGNFALVPQGKQASQPALSPLEVSPTSSFLSWTLTFVNMLPNTTCVFAFYAVSSRV